MLNPTICCRQRCKLWGIDLAIDIYGVQGVTFLVLLAVIRETQ
jgi:hypothetical protein